MSGLQVEVVVPARALCGEGPTWDARTGEVSWVDIVGRRIFATDYATFRTRSVEYSTMVGAALPRSGGGWVIASEDGFAAVGAEGEVEHSVDVLDSDHRMNDAKVDRLGRLWAGSCAYDFAAGEGALWMLDASWRPSAVVTGITQPNGLDWSPDGTTLYLIDTQLRHVLAYPLDGAGDISGPAITLVGDAHFGGDFPDGLTVDARGHLWIAVYAAGVVQEYDGSGAFLRSIPLPVSQPTSCAFVGPELDDLWVTSAADGTTADAEPHAGSVFRVRGHGATGCASTPFAG